MSFYDNLLKLLHKFDRRPLFISVIINAISLFLDTINSLITKIYNNFYFDSLDIDGVEYFERLLKIIPKPNQTITDRRSQIRAKWLSKGKCDIVQIQQVCESWRQGEVDANFAQGVITLAFRNQQGIPDDLQNLLNAIDEIKPAHLGYTYYFKWLLIRDIHEVKTIEEMEELTISQFARGYE